MYSTEESLELFLSLSISVTGFDRVDLLGTGLAQEYYEQVVNAAGSTISQELRAVVQNLPRRTDNELETAIRQDLLSSPKFGPVVRNIIQLWYEGTWNGLPQTWRNQYGVNSQDFTQITSPAAYQQGLIWKTMSSHPNGAKQPGFGSWSMNPTRK